VSTMLDRMRSIMAKNGVKASQVTTRLGISNSSFTDWGKGKGTPSVLVVAKFAELFDESLDYIITGKEYSSKKLEFSSKNEMELLEKYKQLNQECKIKLFGYIDGMLATMPKVENEEKRLSI